MEGGAALSSAVGALLRRARGWVQYNTPPCSCVYMPPLGARGTPQHNTTRHDTTRKTPRPAVCRLLITPCLLGVLFAWERTNKFRSVVALTMGCVEDCFEAAGALGLHDKLETAWASRLFTMGRRPNTPTLRWQLLRRARRRILSNPSGSWVGDAKGRSLASELSSLHIHLDAGSTSSRRAHVVRRLDSPALLPCTPGTIKLQYMHRWVLSPGSRTTAALRRSRHQLQTVLSAGMRPARHRPPTSASSVFKVSPSYPPSDASETSGANRKRGTPETCSPCSVSTQSSACQISAYHQLRNIHPPVMQTGGVVSSVAIAQKRQRSAYISNHTPTLYRGLNGSPEHGRDPRLCGLPGSTQRCLQQQHLHGPPHPTRPRCLLARMAIVTFSACDTS